MLFQSLFFSFFVGSAQSAAPTDKFILPTIFPVDERRVEYMPNSWLRPHFVVGPFDGVRCLRLRFLMDAFQIEQDLTRICLTGINGPRVAAHVMADQGAYGSPVATGATLPLEEKLDIIFTRINQGGIEYLTEVDKRHCLESIQNLLETRAATRTAV